MGFEMVARLSCEANHQNSCITKHISHHSNPTIQKPKGKCHASRHASHPVTFCGGFSFTEGLEIHKAVMGKERVSKFTQRGFLGIFDLCF